MKPRVNLYKEFYTMPPALSKEAISEALSLFTQEEREELMRKNMEPDKPELDLSQVSNMEFDDIHHSDYPDFSDAFCCAAEYQDRDMTEAELDDLNENYREFVYNKIIGYLF